MSSAKTSQSFLPKLLSQKKNQTTKPQNPTCCNAQLTWQNLKPLCQNMEKYINKWSNEGEGRGTQPGVSLDTDWARVPGQAEHPHSVSLQPMHTGCISADTAHPGPQHGAGLWVISLNGKLTHSWVTQFYVIECYRAQSDLMLNLPLWLQKNITSYNVLSSIWKITTFSHPLSWYLHRRAGNIMGKLNTNQSMMLWESIGILWYNVKELDML